MPNLLQQIAGKYGKALTTVGTTFNLPQLAPGGAGAALQSWGGQANAAMPLVPVGQPYVPTVNNGPTGPTGYGGGAPNPTPTVLGANISRTTGGGGAPGPQQQPAGNQTLQNNINQQTNDFSAQLESDYQAALSNLSSQESGLRSQADVANQQIGAQYGPAQTAIQNEQTTNEAGLTKQGQQAQTQQTSAMQQARDLFRQTQQSNIAQLSGLGISSSSVTEALAEKLGVETARRIAGVSNSTNDIMKNLAAETTRVQTYYKGKLSDLEAQKSAALGNIQNSLMQGLNQINQARSVAAQDKANQRMQLFSNAQNAIAQLQAQAQNFQQSLDTWAAQKSAALKDAQSFVATPADFSQLNSQVAGLSNIGNQGLQGYGQTINVNPTAQGYKVGATYTNKQLTPMEQLLQQYGQTGQ